MGKQSRQKKARRQTLTYYDHLAMQLVAMKQIVGEPITSYYYPGCGLDGTPRFVFPSARSLHLDEDPKIVEGLRLARVPVVRGKLQEYLPSQLFDLLILHNPQAATTFPAKAVRPGGYVATNNFHGQATLFHLEPEQFRAVAAIAMPTSRGQPPSIAHFHPEECWEPVRGDAEFAAIFPKVFPRYLELTQLENVARQEEGLPPLSVCEWFEKQFGFKRPRDWSTLFVFQKL